MHLRHQRSKLGLKARLYFGVLRLGGRRLRRRQLARVGQLRLQRVARRLQLQHLRMCRVRAVSHLLQLT